MVIYEGLRTKDGCRVTANGRELCPRYDLVNHSPDGFNWGYNGSGPAQLALAIVADHCGNDEPRVLHLYQYFKYRVIAGLAGDCWTLDSRQIEEELRAIEKDISCSMPA